MTGHAVASAVLVAAALAAVQPEQQRPGFSSGIDLVSFGVTVTDRKGKLVTDLTEQDFEVYEDGNKQRIRYFLAGGGRSGRDASPVPEFHLGALIDVSGSMTADLDLARRAAVRFLNALSEVDDITLVDFDTEVRIARYDASNFVRLTERIRRLQPAGYTALYDALAVYLDSASSEQGRKILVMYTDGADNLSTISRGDVRQMLRASDVTVYAVGFFGQHPTALALSLKAQLRELAEITGGELFVATTLKDLDAAYEEVKKEIDARYVLGYLSTNERADGTWRKVEIKVVGPERRGVNVRTREGYFAPYRPGGRGSGPGGAGTDGEPHR